MTSAINTGSINTNYPIPGVNNSSQGFRDNFSGTVNNFNIAANEITDLQNKAVVKSALNGVTLNNDMANTLISNALVQNFRATTYNLGNNISGSVTIDVTRGDVQYGGVTGPITLEFVKWAPAGTQSNVQVILSNLTAGSQINLPTNVKLGNTTIEHYTYSNVGNIIVSTITVPDNVTQLHYNFSTLDCGTTIEIQSLDRPRQSTQVLSANVFPSNPLQGDIRFIATSNTAGNFFGFNGTSWVQLNN